MYNFVHKCTGTKLIGTTAKIYNYTQRYIHNLYTFLQVVEYMYNQNTGTPSKIMLK